MLIPQKSQYALRAVFELARRHGNGPIKIAEIAEAQAIPPRFLSVILSQLKQGGFVESKRGSEGGYSLSRAPRQITVGEILAHMNGPVILVECLIGESDEHCRLKGTCPFEPMWREAKRALTGVYDGTTFADLVERALQTPEYVSNYSI